MLPQDEDSEVDAASNLWHAVRIVMIADAVMSLDNVIAVAAAAKGNLALLIIGLALSIPLVVYGATLLIKLISRFPVIVSGGAALIGFIGGEVILTDLAIEPWINAHAAWLHHVAPIAGAIAVVLVGRVVAPPPAPTPLVVAEEAAGAAVFAGFRLAFQVFGRLLVTQAPLIISVIGSVFGYVASEAAITGHEGDVSASASALQAVRPIFAAVIAVGLGEVVGWLARRVRGEPAPEHSSS